MQQFPLDQQINPVEHHVLSSRSREKVKNWQPYESTSFSVPYRSKTVSSTRPAIPYAQLIAEAIESTATGRITLNGIYNHVTTQHPYFETAGAGWKNSVRHNLSLNKNFVRVPRPAHEKGKGAYWTFSQERGPAKISTSRKPKNIPTPQQNIFYSPHQDQSHFQMLYQNPNPDIYDTAIFHDDSLVASSQQSFATEQPEEFSGRVGGKGMYLDQFERILALEQTRQSSSTSIETFHTFEETMPSNMFYDVQASNGNYPFDAFEPSRYPTYDFDQNSDAPLWLDSDTFQEQGL